MIILDVITVDAHNLEDLGYAITRYQDKGYTLSHIQPIASLNSSHAHNDDVVETKQQVDYRATMYLDQANAPIPQPPEIQTIHADKA